MSAQIEIEVNGSKHTLQVEPNLTLLELLREKLRLTGTKEGCGQGDCGTCMVMVDGKPVNSCLMLALDADGCRIKTIEGMASGKDLHPLQESFIEHGAVQCGYCTPGMIISAASLLKKRAQPGRGRHQRGLKRGALPLRLLSPDFGSGPICGPRGRRGRLL